VRPAFFSPPPRDGVVPSYAITGFFQLEQRPDLLDGKAFALPSGLRLLVQRIGLGTGHDLGVGRLHLCRIAKVQPKGATPDEAAIQIEKLTTLLADAQTGLSAAKSKPVSSKAK
jgi:hypothetical protein